MPKDINLLPKLMESEARKSEYKRVGSLLSFGLIGFAVIILLGLFLWSFLINLNMKKVAGDIAGRETSVKDNIDKEIKLRAIKSKLTAVKPLLASPNYLSQALTKLGVVQSSTPSIVVTEIVVDPTKVTFSGRVPTATDLETFLDTLLDPDIGGKNFSHIVLTALSRGNNDAEYRFGLDMVYTPSQEANESPN